MKLLTHLTGLVAVLALAVGVSTGVAGIRPDNRATHGPGVVLEGATASTRPDDGAKHGVGPLGGSLAQAVRPDDRAWRGIGPEPVLVPVAAPAPTSSADGFDWTDAGIGAVGAVGLVLVLAGGAVFVIRRNRVPAFS
jgi:hypothetical protein